MSIAFQLCVPLLKSRRPVRNARHSFSKPTHFARRKRVSCGTLPSDRIESAGSTLPEPGQLVLTPGKWAEEDGAGIVENVRFVESRGTHVVDVIEMRRVASDLFARGSRARGTASAKWYDVADVRVISQPEYISSQDAYRIPDARDGYATVQPLDKESKARADAEYVQLKQYMLKVTSTFGFLGTVAFAALLGIDGGRAFAYGAGTSLVYLLMLQSSVDVVGDKQSFVKKLLSLRFLVPAIPFIALSRSVAISGTSFAALQNSIPKAQVGALLVGLLSYKVPLLLKTGGEFIDGLAQIQPGTSGMLGTVASLTARSLQKRRDGKNADEDGSVAVRAVPPVIIFAGPSGAGKSTLMGMLEADYADKIGYSISHTTREKRDGEVEGVDYYFIDNDVFEKMIVNGELIEHAKVHGRYYGTSFAAVESVLSSEKACILDLDIQGIESVRQKQDLPWTPRLVWVAPPSMNALRDRLLKRGTETDATLKVRLDTAMREMTFAATNSIFDLTIINEKLEDAYTEVKDFIDPLISEFIERD